MDAPPLKIFVVLKVPLVVLDLESTQVHQDFQVPWVFLVVCFFQSCFYHVYDPNEQFLHGLTSFLYWQM